MLMRQYYLKIKSVCLYKTKYYEFSTLKFKMLRQISKIIRHNILYYIVIHNYYCQFK